MRKTIWMATILLLSLALLSSCVNQDDKLRASTQTDADSGKPLLANYLSYAIDKEFFIGEDVFIELSYGTRVTKQEIDLYPDENMTEPYELELYAISKEGGFTWQDGGDAIMNTFNDPSKTILLVVENFYAEKYPIPSDNEKASKTKAIIPKSLFIGNKGQIIIAMYYYGEYSSFEINYAIENDKIFLSK